MKKIIFLCHGNICRSPMAEYVFKDMVRKAGREKDFEITSAAVSDEEWGNPMYPPARAKLREKGIPFGRHSAHKISRQEFDDNDLVIVMDRSNLRLLERIVGNEARSEKVRMLMEYTGEARDVADPWYTRDFETTYIDLQEGCKALLNTL